MTASRLPACIAATLVAWLALHELHVVVPGLGGAGGPLFGRWVHVVVMAAGGLLVIARAIAAREERLGWSLIGGALLAWTAGEAYFTLVLWDLASPPVPSPADVGFLLFPVLGLSGIVALACARVRRADRMMAVDAATAALAAGAVSAALVFGAVVGVVGGDRLALATNLAYPVTDLLLLATVVAVAGLQRWRVGRTWALLAAGCLLFTVTDGIYLVQVARGTWASGGPFDAGWWAAAPLWALAAWAPARAHVARLEDAPVRRRDLLPLLFAAVALTVLVTAAVRHVNMLAIALAAAALVASTGRLHLTLRAHAASLRRAQGEALTDPLTGLGNRRLLATDLDERMALLGDDGELMLVVFDLDGFKHYNDVFGHPAGDAALVRLAARLRDAVGLDGRAYRLGGDEFCALMGRYGDDWESRLAACQAALCEEGEGYAIGCSHGAILIPQEASHSTEALRLADQRMYARKQDGRLSAIRQATDALVTTLAERFPDLGGDAVEEVRRAAELHDIVARIVRSTHERSDGCGSPDQLAVEACAGTQFDPAVVTAFVAVWRDARPAGAAAA
jgi:diguanylate cyclase (GGDEF)-like protein